MTKIERLGLTARLLELRREGKSIEECARILSEESGKNISARTVSRTLKAWQEEMREVRQEEFREKVIEDGDRDWARLERLLDWSVGIVEGRIPAELRA